MNDHVAKPVDPERLYVTLLRWLPVPASESAGVTEARHDAGSSPVSLRQALAECEGLDFDAALAHAGGQVHMLEQVLRRFVAVYGHGLPGLLDATTPKAANRWHAACHSLRGACATIGAVSLASQVEALESQLADGGDVASCAPAARHLHQHLLELVGRLSAGLGSVT